MRPFAVVLIGDDGVLAGRDSLKVVHADNARQAVDEAHGGHPPNRYVKHAWVHELAGKASLLEVDVAAPKWGRLREDTST